MKTKKLQRQEFPRENNEAWWPKFSFSQKVDEEQKVEAVREFYVHAEENKTTFDAAESLLFYGKERPRGKHICVILALLKRSRGGCFPYTVPFWSRSINGGAVFYSLVVTTSSTRSEITIQCSTRSPLKYCRAGICRLQNLTVVNTGMFPPRNLVEHVLCGM